MNHQKEAKENTLELHRVFQQLLDDEKEQGDLGVTSFKVVYDELMEVQKEKRRCCDSSRGHQEWDSSSPFI